MTQGIGIFIITQLLRRLPAEFAQMGYSEALTAKYLFWGCTAICLIVFLLATFGLSRNKPAGVREREPILTLIRLGMNAARENSRIALAFGCSFAARGDVLVVGTFSFLWTQQAAEDLGLGIAAGYQRGGMGETSTIIAGNALIGQNAPAQIRGSVLGCFALSAATGILIATAIGGRLFDQWMAGGPFVLMGIINSLVLIAAITVRIKTGKYLPN